MNEVATMDWKSFLRMMVPRILKAVLWCFLIGVGFLLLESFLALFFFDFYPEAQKLFGIFTWAILVFVFLDKVSEGTIYKYMFMIGRSFFLILYFIYATNGGVLTVKALGFFEGSGLRVTLQFAPIVVLLVLGNLITMVKDIIQAINFLTETQV
jgi:hypothetical protein